MKEGYQFNDGGRAAAGFKGSAGDCVCRAICIASGRPYQEVYDRLAHGNATQRVTKHSAKRGSRGRSAANGIWTQRKWFKDYMRELGFVWTPTMKIGSGTTVHLSNDELPSGRLVVAVSKHYTTMIDGVVNDTFDPRREDSWMHETVTIGGMPVEKVTKIGGRAVYGYWSFQNAA